MYLSELKEPSGDKQLKIVDFTGEDTKVSYHTLNNVDATEGCGEEFTLTNGFICQGGEEAGTHRLKFSMHGEKKT